jgi:uncharacterized protein (TIGR02466 family)
MQKKLLWPTPVYSFDLDMSEEDNQYLFSLLSSSIDNRYGAGVNVPELKDKVVQKLYNNIHEALNEVIYDVYPKKYEYILTRGWASIQNPGENLIVHGHGGIAFAAVYYVKTPPNSGDLLLLDPRGGVNWYNESNGLNSSVIYERITPKENMLFVFPGFLLHEVETNKSSQQRMCIANNIICKPKQG